MKAYLAILVLIGVTIGGSATACTVSSSALVFGAINPLVAADTDSAADIDVDCPTLSSYEIQLSTGNGTYLARYLVSGSLHLYYNLYTDAARTSIWGDGSGGSVTVSASATVGINRHTVYGRIPHDSSAVPGIYSDSIVVTVTF